MEDQLEVILIPQPCRNASHELIQAIAQAVFGSKEEALFAEAFVPPGGRVPEPKALNFANFLIRGPRHLWAIKVSSEIVGFILVSDIPFQNALGMGINSGYTGKGIMVKALNQVLASDQLYFPLHGYTSSRNLPAQRLLEKTGFIKDSTPVGFLGESSIHFFLKEKLSVPQVNIAFGDIHGCFKAAETAVKIAEEKNYRGIFLGDYIDRGPSAVKTLQVLIHAKQKHPDWIFLRGNHDQMLLDLITGKASVTDFGSVLGMEFGYSQAAKSYKEWTELEKTEQNRIFDFLQETSFYYETSGFVFCHALLRDTQESIHQKSSEELIWNYSYSPLWEGKIFIHGHLPVKIPTITGRGININTSCGYGGYLTGLILETTEAKDIYSYILINEDGDLFKRATLSER